MRKALCLLLALLVLAPWTAASASEPTDLRSGDFFYRVLADGTAMVTGYSGKKMEIKIPDKIKGKKVTSVGDSAFCISGLISVKLPKTLKRIEAGTFSGSPITEIEIPDSVEYIAGEAFRSCASLASVTLGRGIRELDGNPFMDCPALVDFRLAADHPVLEVADGALYTRADRRLVFYPPARTAEEGTCAIREGTEIIGANALELCLGMREAVIPDSVREIGDYAFKSCFDLEKAEIPAGVTRIGDGVFSNCGWLTGLSVSPENTAYDLRDGGLYSRENQRLIWYPIWDQQTSSYTVAEGTKGIGADTFLNAGWLTQVILPDGLEEIGEGAFMNCDALREARLPASLRIIGRKAFCACSALEDIGTTAGLQSIGTFAFTNCSSLESFAVPSGVKEIPRGVFNGASRLRTVTLSEGVETIGEASFEGCSALEEIILPSTLREIDRFAFRQCGAMKSVAFNQGLKTLGIYVFYHCASLTEAVLPEGLEKMGSCVFYGCTSLVRVQIPKSVKEIQGDLFGDCPALEEILVYKGSTAAKVLKKHKKLKVIK